MENLPRSIYRSDDEIRSFDEQQRSMLDAGADDPEKGALGDCAQPDQIQVKRNKWHKDATNPYTSASADIVASDAKKISSLEDPSTIVTPADRLSNLNLALHKQMTGRNCRMTWEEYNVRAQQKCLPWWQPQGQLSREEQRTAEKLRVDAMRAVKSSVICTNCALILHVKTGSLGSDRPIMETSALPPKQAVPSLVVIANGLRQNGVATFGRVSARGVGLSPDYEMQEPIASRSHFAITYDQEKQQYCLRDTGSKWGTFLKIGSEGRELNCGDWIRAGVAEFVVRHCGGGCSCHKHHAQYRIQSLRLSRQYAGPQLRAVSAVVPRERPHFIDPDMSSDMSRAEELQDELALLFSRRGHYGWMTTSTHLCQSAASRSPRHFPKADEDSGHSRDSCGHNSDNASATVQLTSVPTTPLELEFLSGPRMGEKVVLWDRLCTLGRGEQNTIQVSDANLANVSRVHCIFEYVGRRWRIRDNKSTNGTWRRLSCILQPSAAVPLVGGETILAGTHEFKVEEVKAQTGQHCLPSVAATTLAEMCQASADTNTDSSCYAELDDVVFP
jgi:pSer/pThr/pTyr-binding forkhead associated (FHA) protein